MNTSRVSFARSISANARIAFTPGCSNCARLRTTVSRLGSGLPIDSNVLRPITITCPVVIFLNHLKSSGKCHGILLPWPMTRLIDMAAIALKCFTAAATVAFVIVERPCASWHCPHTFSGGELALVDVKAQELPRPQVQGGGEVQDIECAVAQRVSVLARESLRSCVHFRPSR